MPEISSETKESRLKQAHSRSEDFVKILFKHFENPSVFLTEGSEQEKFKQMDYDGIDAFRVDNEDKFQFKIANLENTDYTDKPEEMDIGLRYKSETGTVVQECQKFSSGEPEADYIVFAVYHKDTIVHYRILDYQELADNSLVVLTDSYSIGDASDKSEFRFIVNEAVTPVADWTHFNY